MSHKIVPQIRKISLCPIMHGKMDLGVPGTKNGSSDDRKRIDSILLEG